MPHSINHGDASFAYFNKIWGIPIGHAISSGCIRLTNEDAIDLYNRVTIGTPVVVLGPGQALSLASPWSRGS
jgi:L,D-transpeptidase catalytic domain